MYKTWIFHFFIYGLIFFIFFISFNFFIDPYGIFGNNTFSKIKNHIASYRITKLYYIKRKQPKTILIGTSRIGVINPKYLEKYTTDKAYNLSLSASSIKEEYLYIKYIIKKYKIKNIIWGLDFLSFNPDAKLPFVFTSQRLKESLYIKDYKDSLLSMDAFIASISTLVDNIKGNKNKVDLATGQNLFLKHQEGLKKQGISFIDLKIKEGLKGYENTKELFNSIKFKSPKNIDKNFFYIKDIIYICKKNRINLYIYINPVYIETLKLINKLGLWPTYKHLLKELSRITSFWNFNENIEIISDKNNFWDNSHMREEIGNMIIDTLFNKNKNYSYIEKTNIKNISKHIKLMEKILKNE